MSDIEGLPDPDEIRDRMRDAVERVRGQFREIIEAESPSEDSDDVPLIKL